MHHLMGIVCFIITVTQSAGSDSVDAEELCASVLYVNNCWLLCVFVELTWICLDTQRSVQQQADCYPSQSFCPTGRFAPTVSSVFH